MSSKTKTGLFQTPVSKPSPTTPRGKLGSSATSLRSDGDSPSTIPRFSIDRSSPKIVTPRPVSRSSSRGSTPDKSQPRVNKPSELQAQLQAAQDDLKKAKERLILSEKEKTQALTELKDAKRLADEANEKLCEALAAQKQAEESSEIEKFHAAELEQAGTDASREKEEELMKELESVRSQLLSSEDMARFLAATEELQRVKLELAMVVETKNQALAHADDATKIAEMQAEKVEFLSHELARLKGMLESKAEGYSSENGVVEELRCELGLLREELEKAKGFQESVFEREKNYEMNVADLKLQLETVKARERELAEKGALREKIVAEMTEELVSRELDLEKAKVFERDLIEKGKLQEETVAELSLKLSSLEQQLYEAKSLERDFIEKETTYGKIVEELKSNLDDLRLDLEKSKASERDLVDREKSHNVNIRDLNSEIDSLKRDLENAVEKEISYEQTVVEFKSEIDSLSQALEKAKSKEEEIVERETLNEKVVRGLECEVCSLKEEVRVARCFEEKATRMEEMYELTNVELEAAKMGQLYTLNSLNEWKTRAEDLEQIEELYEQTNVELEATRMGELYALNSLDEWKTRTEELERKVAGNNDALHEAECEVVALKEKVSLLENTLVKREEESEVLECRLRKAEEEAVEAATIIESVRSELETVKKEKKDAVNELDTLKEDEEKSRRAMDSLTLALHEVSAEAREAKERLLSSQEEREYFETQVEHLQKVVKETSDKYEAMLEDSNREIDRLTTRVKQSNIEFDTQIEDLKAVLKASNEKYESMLKESKTESNRLNNTLEKLKSEHDRIKVEWEAKELELLTHVKSSELNFEEEKCSMEKETMRLVNLLRETEEKVVTVQKALEEAKADCLKLKDRLLCTENKLGKVTRENEQLRALEDANVRRIDELTKLLDEARAHHQSTENGELSDSDKEYDLLPKVVEFSEENGHMREHKQPQQGGAEKTLLSKEMFQTGVIYPDDVNEKPATPETVDRVRDESSGSDAKMWESYTVDREFSTEMETEQGSLDDEAESKADNAESLDHDGNPSENGSNSDSKQKKKKPLYRKFGNLLKKGISNPK